MIITTTNNIEYFDIQEYKGIITHSVVLGANVLSDFIASFTDFFGGHSGVYENKLNEIAGAIFCGLETKAIDINANAVVGVRFDFSQVSGKGMSMLMATATGTAVCVTKDTYGKMTKLHNLKMVLQDGIISSSEYEIEKNRIIEKYDNPYIEKTVQEMETFKALVESAFIQNKKEDPEILILEKIAEELSSDIMNQKISVKEARSRFAGLQKSYQKLNVEMPDYIEAIQDMI